MILQIFSVRDIKTDQFANPMFLITKGHAIRSFADAVNDKEPNNQLNKHPEDFELHHLGEFDTDSGLINANPPKQVVTASEVITNK